MTLQEQWPHFTRESNCSNGQ